MEAEELREESEEESSSQGEEGKMRTSHCFRCGRLLTNPISVALGIGPVCRGRIATSSGSGWSGPSKPGYPMKDTVGITPPGFEKKQGLCGCQITSIPSALLGVTFAQECYNYCCIHCPSSMRYHCSAEVLRNESLLRDYQVGGGRHCLGYWTEETEEKSELWAVYYDDNSSLIGPNLLWKAKPLDSLKGSTPFVSLGNPGSLLEAQIIALQETPLKE